MVEFQKRNRKIKGKEIFFLFSQCEGGESERVMGSGGERSRVEITEKVFVWR